MNTPQKKSTDMNARVIVALDMPRLEDVEKILASLKGVISFYKIGFELFTAHGWKAVELVQKFGGRVFLDLKLHDIPTTVAKTAAVICDHEVDMFNVHALGGLEMMRKTREAVDEKIKAGKKRPIVLAVTILTSHREEELVSDLGISKKLPDQVLGLAQLAKKARLDGVVSSPQEIPLLRRSLPADFVIVTPGIRMAENSLNDQKRTDDPASALHAGSSYLVIGRPIIAAPDPQKAALLILNQISSIKPSL